MSDIRPLIAGNWKMHGLAAALAEARALALDLEARPAAARVAICPPATLIARMAALLEGGPIEIGGQDCHVEDKGAFTGDLSAEMLHDAGARLVILGHSERRTHHRESDEHVADKVRAALRAGLEPVICVGESLEERKAGNAARIVRDQIDASLPAELDGRPFAVAYEPIWAIGTGLVPTLAEIAQVHGEIRGRLVARFGAAGEVTPILYGGSVKPSNAAEILAVRDVGGALVGGASLKASDFLDIIRTA